MSDNKMLIKHDSNEDLDSRIEALKKELDHLLLLKEHIDTPSLEVQEMAEVLHSHLCGHNHTDGCDWFYGSWDKQTSSHRDYVKRAEAVIETLKEAEGRNYALVMNYVSFVDDLLRSARKA